MRGPRLKRVLLSDICGGEDMEACLGHQIQEALYVLGQQLKNRLLNVPDYEPNPNLSPGSVLRPQGGARKQDAERKEFPEDGDSGL